MTAFIERLKEYNIPVDNVVRSAAVSANLTHSDTSIYHNLIKGVIGKDQPIVLCDDVVRSKYQFAYLCQNIVRGHLKGETITDGIALFKQSCEQADAFIESNPYVFKIGDDTQEGQPDNYKLRKGNKSGKSGDKKVAAQSIFDQHYKTHSRKDVIAMLTNADLMSPAEPLTPGGASTYYQTMKRAVK